MMRARAMPGEDPATLRTPEDLAPKLVEICSPRWTETGKVVRFSLERGAGFPRPGIGLIAATAQICLAHAAKSRYGKRPRCVPPGAERKDCASSDARQGHCGPASRVPAFERSGSSLSRARRAPRGIRRRRGKARHGSLRAYLPGAPGCHGAAGRSADRPDQVKNRFARRRGHQGRALGAEVARLPGQEEPQGALHVAQHRGALGGGRRTGASPEHQRRRDPLPHHSRRGA